MLQIFQPDVSKQKVNEMESRRTFKDSVYIEVAAGVTVQL
jgi:hypothetical protein